MKCKASFFGKREMPQIDISAADIERLAAESTNAHLAVPGVQKKLSVHLSDDHSSRLTLVGYPAGYILKPQSDEYPELPEAEDLAMDIAEMMGIAVVPHGLIDTSVGMAYITERVDRKDGKVYAMEDFCQLSERLTGDKYRGSYERCAAVIRKHSVRVGYDMSEFYLRLVVSFVIGNSDMHLKNFSLIETAPANRKFVLSPAYDLLPANLILPEDREEMALTLNGKKANIQRSDFLTLAEHIGLNASAADKILQKVIRCGPRACALCDDSFLSSDMKKAMKNLMQRRISRIE